LISHAVRITRQEADSWNLTDLARVLAKVHKLNEATVLAVLDEAPELVRVGHMIRPRRAPGPRRLASDRSFTGRTWRDVETELVLFLSELETETVHLDVVDAQRSVILRMRLDFVQDRGKSASWLACLVEDAALHDQLVQDGPLALGPDWSLPLSAPVSPPTLPEVLVWRTASPRHAASVVQDVLERRLGVPAERVRLRRDSCTPAELDTRVNGEQTVRKLRARRGRLNASVRDCDRCGQPLSDPESVALGIGPECRKYYSREVLAAVRKPGTTLPRRGAKKQSLWRSELFSEWGVRRPHQADFPQPTCPGSPHGHWG
jgi:hypothetical protein